ncbi:MAG: hypothetical protein ACT6TH_11505 [Brevundimonas sp.]|uniref:hypothetical protein n=1 Tax=Brevundimonas sp. TaxID=1871086 RepID=UPI00403491EC
MIKAYGDIFSDVSRVLEGMGMGLSKDSDYSAVFADLDGRSVALLGDDRGHPAYQLRVLSGTGGRSYGEGFAIDILMDVWPKRIEKGKSVATLSNQLWFIEKFGSQIFSIVPGGKISLLYDRANRGYQSAFL